MSHNPMGLHGLLQGNFYILFFFLNSHSWGGGIQTWSTRHVGHFWPIVPAPGDCEDRKFGGMKIGRESRSILGDNLPQRHFVHHKSHFNRSGHEPGPRGAEASD
jgi:hypothetical protein